MKTSKFIIRGIAALVFAGSIGAGAGYVVNLAASEPMEILISTPRAPVLTKSNHAQIFGHPMVPGGIFTYADLFKNASLYPMLDYNAMQFTTLKYNLIAYVSYMKNGKMYWTKKPRFIKAGEAVISGDGYIILERCGNLIKITDPTPDETLIDEPLDVYPLTTNEIVSVQDSMILDDLAAPPTEGPLSSSIPTNQTEDTPMLFSMLAVDTIGPTPPHITNVPEPSTLALLALGLVTFMIIPALVTRFFKGTKA